MIDRSPVLSDQFLCPNFNQIKGGLLKKFFIKEAWELVSQQIKQKKNCKYLSGVFRYMLGVFNTVKLLRKMVPFDCAGRDKSLTTVKLL